MIIALGVAAAVAAVVWWRRPQGLKPPVDVVGLPIYANFDFHPGFLAYRLVVWVIPVVATIVLWLLASRGPLRSPPVRASARPAPERAETATIELDRSEPNWTPWVGLLLPATAVAIAVEAGDAAPGDTVGAKGVLAALVYVLLAVAVALAAAARPQGDVRELLVRTHPPLAALAASVALCSYSRSASVHLDDGSVDHWRWMPLWLCVSIVLVAVAAPIVAVRRGHSPAAVHRAVLVGLVGTVLVVMVTSALPGNVGQLQGFDDMQSVTGADLMIRGYFPWRDITLIHGVFEDGLRSWLGFPLFERTMWATGAVAGAVWLPLAWSGMYLLGAWTCRGRLLPSLVVLAGAVYASTQVQASLRWCFAPFVFILLGEALRRGTRRWTFLVTAALFCEAVLVPEASFQVVAVVGVLLVHDLTGHGEGESRWQSLRTTRWFVDAGLVLTAVCALFFAYHHSLRAFVTYFVIFGPGHVEAGALPFGSHASDRYEVMFAATTALVMVTLLVAGWTWVARRAVTADDWVILAAALTAGLYGEKALGRFDDGHLLQSIYVSLMLVVLWLARLLVWSDASLTRRWARRVIRDTASTATPTRTVPLVSALVLAVAFLTLHPLRAEASTAPSGNKTAALSLTLPGIGYASSDTYDPTLLQDLSAVIDTLGGPERTVFDFTNSPGFFWYLLGLSPTTSYFHVSMAIPPFAQEDLVEQLEEDPPALVVFDAPFGLPSWDGVSNPVRHYEVSQYLLDGWTPVVSTHGVLFMLRNDLMADRPALPALSEQPTTDGLYFSSTCSWGYIPDFLPRQDGETTSVDVAPDGYARRIVLRGWATDPSSSDPVRVLVATGDRVVATEATTVPRPDVVEALGPGMPADAGFDIQVVTPERGLVRVYAQYADGKARQLGDRGEAVAALKLPDGSEVPVVEGERALGALDQAHAARGRVSAIDMPPGFDLRDVGSVTFQTAGKPFARSDLLVTDSLTAGTGDGRFIRFLALPLTGDQLNVRVGACLQWHGFSGEQLYLYQRHGAAVREVQLVRH